MSDKQIAIINAVNKSMFLNYGRKIEIRIIFIDSAI